MPNGKCKMHGGKSPGAPVTHGRYSLRHIEAVQVHLDTARAERRPKDLTEEVALLRALLSDLLTRFTRAPSAEQVAAIGDQVERISRVAERAARIENQTALTAAEVLLLQARLADIVVKYVPPEHRKECAAALRSLSLGADLA